MAEARPFHPLTLRAIEAGIRGPWFAVIEGARLRKLRREAGLSQKRLASQAKVSIRTIWRLEGMEEGRCYPSTGVRLARGLGLDPIALIREFVSVRATQERQ